MIRDLEERRLSLDSVLAEVDAWNLANPVGTVVEWRAFDRADSPVCQGRTSWNATILGDGTPVAWISGAPSCIPLSQVTVITS